MSTPLQQNPAFGYSAALNYAPASLPSEPQSASAVAGTSTTQPQSRQAAEDARKDRTLAEFMLMLDDYEPLVPTLHILSGLI